MTQPSDCAAVRLRPACPRDLDVVVAIDRKCMPPGWPADEMAAVLEEPRWRLKVAETAPRTVVGFCLSRDVLGEVELLKIAVDPSWGGRGIGGRLLDDLIANTRAARCITLEVRRSNAVALSLYLARGFEVVGERERYYPDGEDALLMTRAR